MYLAKNCGFSIEDVALDNCVFNPSKIVGHLVTTNPTFKLAVSTDLTKTMINQYLAAKTLRLVKGYVGYEGEVTAPTTGTTGYGDIVMTSQGGDLSFTYDYKYSQCTFRKLQSWYGITFYAFPIDENNNIGGELIWDNDEAYLKGVKSTFSVPSYLPFRGTDDNIVSPFIWNASKIKLDVYVPLAFDLDEVDGVITSVFTTSDEKETEYTLTLTTACNGSPIIGAESDIVTYDASGAVVSTTIVDNLDGTYTITGTLTAATYSVNYSTGVIEIDEKLYGGLATNLSFTTSS